MLCNHKWMPAAGHPACVPNTTTEKCKTVICCLLCGVLENITIKKAHTKTRIRKRELDVSKQRIYQF